MIVVSVTNQKGGEGKTTTAINLADGLARRGHKTILLDMDPQGNSTSIHANNGSIHKTMVHIFKQQVGMEEILLPTNKEHLLVAPANMQLAEMESLSGNSVDAPYILKDSLAEINSFDFCIIDCPPSLSIFTINALVASHHVLVPLQAEKFSVDGILGLQQTINSIKRRINPELQILGALITQLKAHTVLTRTITPVLKKYFKIFQTTISEGVSIGESHLARSSVFEYNPKSRQAREYENFTEEFLNELQK